MHVGTSKVSMVVRREGRKTKHSHWLTRSHMGRPPDKGWHLLPGPRQGKGNSRVPNSIRSRISSSLDWSGKSSHLLPSSNVSKDQVAETAAVAVHEELIAARTNEVTWSEMEHVL